MNKDSYPLKGLLIEVCDTPQHFDPISFAEDLYMTLTAENFIEMYKRMGELLCGFVSAVGGVTDGK